MPLFVLFPGFGDSKEQWNNSFISMLKKIGDVFFPPDIHKKKKVLIKQYCIDLKIPHSDKIILIAHSIGLWFALEYSKVHKADSIISLDGTLIGPYIKSAVTRVLSKLDSPTLLVDLVKQAPLKETKFPVPTICFRNIYSTESLKDKELEHNKQSMLESNNIKNYEVHFFANAGHYPHENAIVRKTIIKHIKNLLII